MNFLKGLLLIIFVLTITINLGVAEPDSISKVISKKSHKVSIETKEIKVVPNKEIKNVPNKEIKIIPNDETSVLKLHNKLLKMEEEVFEYEKKIIPKNINKKDYLLGNFRSTKKNDFKQIPKKYTDGRKMYLRTEVVDKYIEMAKAAKKDGVILKCVSAFRSFNHQKSIFEGKYLGKRLVGGQRLNKTIKDPKKRIKKIMLYSSMPGTSRHHWGTDLDLNSLSSSYFESGRGLKIFKWLNKNGEKYGFIRAYTEGRKYGYNVEEWHYSYYPYSKKILKYYNETITPKDIKEFQGSKYVEELGIINTHVNGINKRLIPDGVKSPE
jgi:LAS superfamily LD-carboxypeptidase LdcB